MKIKVKLTLGIVVLLFFSVIAVAIFTYIQTNSIFLQQTEMSAKSTVNQEKDSLSEALTKELVGPKIFSRSEIVLRVLSGNAYASDVKYVNQLMADYFNDNPQLDNIFIADAKGTVVANSEPSMVGISLSDMDYAKDVLSSGDVAISETLVSELTGKPIVVLSQPIANADNSEVIGFIGTSVYVESMASNFMDCKLNNAESSKVYIIDSQGNYVWITDRDKMGKPSEINEITEVVAKLQKGGTIESSSIEFKYEGKKMVGAYSALGLTKWTLLIAAEEQELLTPLKNMWLLIGLIELIIIALSSVIGFLFLRRISDPLACITEKLDQLATGDLAVEIPKEYMSYKDEIGKLSVSMNNIVSSLQEKSYVAERIANGDLGVDININSDKDSLSKSMLSVSNSVKGLVDEVKNITDASLVGDLDVRGDSSKFEGEYKEIIEGINRTLDTIIQPIKEATDVLAEVSAGKLDVKVIGDYKGHHAMIKDALNSTIHALSGYVEEITRVLTEISGGNFDVTTSDNYRGDFTRIKNSLDNIINTFNDILCEINAAAQQVANGAKQISDSSQILSQGSTEQASTVEQLSASMEQIADQTRSNAENAEMAYAVAATVKEGAMSGNNQMTEMLKAISEINDAASNISKIIKVIEDIAFQTNILALNAAVEAARAGQHGKGFAVVADEVRNLAARSANAAKETTALIESSIMKTENGLKIAKDTADALNDIVLGISEASNIVNRIANATSEQASAIVQINMGVTQASQVVQNNSANAQEGAAASEEMAGQAEVLKDLVGRFRLKNSINLNETSKNNIDPELLRQVEETLQDESRMRSDGNSKVPQYNESAIILNDNDYGKY